jgi:predicted nucleotidyltransferase
MDGLRMMLNTAGPAAVAIKLCVSWATTVQAAMPCDVYLFGSAIYQGGDQFDARTSDLDLVVVFTDEPDAVERVKRLEKLKAFKAQLELDLIPVLNRTECAEPGVSVVVLTQYELRSNVHKSAVRHFFDRNFFLDLKTPKTPPVLGLPDAGTTVIPDEDRHALEFAQKARNEYLSVAANATGGLPAYDGADPLPKTLTRVAAQLSPDVPIGEWYDTRHGLELVFGLLSKGQGTELEALFRKVSKRRGGRGHRESLTAEDQLLLAELVADLAAAKPGEPILAWYIKFSGQGAAFENRDVILAALRRLAPEAEIGNVRPGSIIIELKTSTTTYELFLRLAQHTVLALVFEVERVEISTSPFGAGPLVERLSEVLASWTPKREWSNRRLEAALGEFVLDRVGTLDAPHFVMADAATRVRGRSQIPTDFLVSSPGDDGAENVYIEVTRYTPALHRRLTSLLDLDMEVILLVVGGREKVEQLAGRLEALRAKVRIVSVDEN